MICERLPVGEQPRVDATYGQSQAQTRGLAAFGDQSTTQNHRAAECLAVDVTQREP